MAALSSGSDQQLIRACPKLKVVNIIVPLRQQEAAGLDSNASGFALSVWQQLFREPGLRGTPTILIGDSIIRGDMP